MTPSINCLEIKLAQREKKHNKEDLKMTDLFDNTKNV